MLLLSSDIMLAALVSFSLPCWTELCTLRLVLASLMSASAALLNPSTSVCERTAAICCSVMAFPSLKLPFPSNKLPVLPSRFAILPKLSETVFELLVPMVESSLSTISIAVPVDILPALTASLIFSRAPADFVIVVAALIISSVVPALKASVIWAFDRDWLEVSRPFSMNEPCSFAARASEVIEETARTLVELDLNSLTS